MNKFLILIFVILSMISCESPNNPKGFIGLEDNEVPDLQINSPDNGTHCLNEIIVELSIIDVSSMNHVYLTLDQNHPHFVELISHEGNIYTYYMDIAPFSGYRTLSARAIDDWDNETAVFINLNITPVLIQISTEIAYDIEKDSNGNIWISTQTGLYRYENGNMTQILYGSFRDIALDPTTNNLWIRKVGCNSEPRFYFFDGENILEEYYIDGLYGNFRVGNDGILSGLYTPDGTYFTFQNGEFSYPLGSSNDFEAFDIDNDGIKWFTTLSDGLKKLENNQLITIEYPNGINPFKMEIDPDNNIWVKGGISLAQYDRTIWHTYTLPDLFSYNELHEEFTVDHDGFVWISGHRVIKFKNGIIHRDFHLESSFAKTIFADTNGDVYVTEDNDLMLINENGLEF